MDKAVYEKYIQPLEPIPTGVRPDLYLDGRIKVVLFDIYGTLLISESGGVHMLSGKTDKALELKLLLDKSHISISPEQLIRSFTEAITKKHQRLRASGVDYPEIEQDRIWMEVLEIENLEVGRNFALEFELIVNPVYPMPNLTPTLGTLKKMGIHLGIISNAQFYTEDVFRQVVGKDLIGLGFNPDWIFYSYQFGYAKPSTHLFKKAEEKLLAEGFSYDDVLYVGNDMLNDVHPAKNVGFKTCLFAGDLRSLRKREDHPLCRNLKPDAVITDLYQIIDLLKGVDHVTSTH